MPRNPFARRSRHTGRAPVHQGRPRKRAVISLFLLAPMVGEFLLGNLPITMLWLLPILAALYGGGALLIRETARHLSLGWTGILLLGLTYAIVEEAFVTASLFNPDYLGLQLLDYGYIPALGIGSWWTVFVLTLHTVWSTAVPIALVEALNPSARRTPWLGWKGVLITAIVFLLGCLATYLAQEPRYVATTAQYVGSGVIAIGLIALALRQREGTLAAGEPGPVPTPRRAGLAALLLGSIFLILVNLSFLIPAFLLVPAMLLVVLFGVVRLRRWSRRASWTALHEVAFAGGLLMTYAWYGFVQVPSIGAVSPLVDALGNLILAFAAGMLLSVTWRRVAREIGRGYPGIT